MCAPTTRMQQFDPMRASLVRPGSLPAASLLVHWTPLDAAEKAERLRRFHDLNAELRRPGQRWGYFTPATCRIFRLLLDRWHNGPTGHCYPTQATIAAAAGCCRETVRLALRELRRHGLLAWSCRRVHLGAPLSRLQLRLYGQPWRQTSNAYRFPKWAQTLPPVSVPPPSEAWTAFEQKIAREVELRNVRGPLLL